MVEITIKTLKTSSWCSKKQLNLIKLNLITDLVYQTLKSLIARVRKKSIFHILIRKSMIVGKNHVNIMGRID